MLLAKFAEEYATQGFEIFPLKPDKTPYTKHAFYDATTNIDKVRGWWERWPEALIGCRAPEGVIIFDVDIRHGGHVTLSKLEERLGELPSTRAHSSGRNDGGLHIWFRIPSDTDVGSARLEEWAKQFGVGSSHNGRHSSGIDLLHHDLRYTILPPSPHPATGQPYWWITDQQQQIAELPPQFLELVTKPEVSNSSQHDTKEDNSPTVKTVQEVGARSPADWYTDNSSWCDLLTNAGWDLVAGDGESDGSQWRHPNATATWSATITNRMLFVYSPNTPFEPTEPGSPHGYTLFKAYATLHHNGDMSQAAKQVRADNPNIWGENSNFEIPLGHIIVADNDIEESGSNAVRWLPDLFWGSTPILEHVKQAAESKMVSPDAVLIALLTRVVALSGHTLELPDIIGKPMGLTLYGVIAGSPGTGKSSAMGVARSLLPAPAGFLDSLPVGSGEGMIEALYDWVSEPNPQTGKKEKVRRQVAHAAIFEIDEGEILADLGRRSGSTLMPVLRSAYTHSTLGQTNASTERKRLVYGETYVFGLTMGLQPEKAQDFLGDAGGGTPQRFLWVEASNPRQPDRPPEWPGVLPWAPPTQTVLEAHRTLPASSGGYVRHRLSIPDAVRDEIVSHHLAVQRGTLTLSEDNAHTYLVQLKTAAALALLDEQLDVEQWHWEMARAILETTTAVRNNVRSILKHQSIIMGREASQKRALMGAHQSKIESEIDLNRLAQVVARAVAKHSVSSPDCSGGCARKCVSRAIASRDRAKYGLDVIVEHAVEQGVVVERGGVFSLPKNG